MQLPQGCRWFTRMLHVSARRHHLVGPNDPVSNLRPIIYTDIQTPPKTGSESRTNHPYSLEEFSDTSSSGIYGLELQFKLKREELDALNHNYWTESNERFEAAKASVLSSLPASASSETREHALSEFYGMWVVQERERQEEYSNQWRKRNFENIVLAARIEYERLKRRIFG